MIDESRVADPPALSPRAGVAMLALQLRRTLQELAAAEARLDAVDADAALWQLRSRLAPLMEDRRRALADELRVETDRADAARRAAQAEAEQIVSDATARADATRRERAEQAARVEAARRASEQLAARTAARSAVPVLPPPTVFDDPLADWAPDEVERGPLPPPVTAPVTSPAPAAALAAPVMARAVTVDDEAGPTPTLHFPAIIALPDDESRTQAGPGQVVHVVIDAESFATAFATAIAAMVDSRAPVQPYVLPVAPAPQKKTSFWSHAWHPDVMLSVLAMVIVVIVLIAWTG